MIRLIIAAVLIAVGVYLFGAFVAWDFNAGNWDQGGRFIIALLMPGLSAIGLIAASALRSEYYDH